MFASFLCILKRQIIPNDPFSGFFIPLVYIPDLSEDSGMTSQQSGMLIAIFGIVNTVGRVGCGWIADKTWCDEILLNCVTVVVGGVLTCFVPYYTTFALMASYCVVFGVATGTVYLTDL